MKKPKQPITFDEKPDPMRDLGIELEGLDDDIIELEDIIEMPDSSIDEDEDLILDVEVLETEADFIRESEQLDEPLSNGQIEPIVSDEEDLMGALRDETDEEEMLFDSVPPAKHEKPPIVSDESRFLDEDDESILDEFLDKPAKTDVRELPEEKIDLKARTAAAMQVFEEPAIADVEFESPVEAPLTPEALDELLASTAELETAPTEVVGALQVEPSQIVEELVNRIESSLQEHMRSMVESMLPDLVKSILAEEIEKLKKEIL